jgi:hypothetical protein
MDMDMNTLLESNIYNILINNIKNYLEMATQASNTISQFKKLLIDHLDPSEKDIDIDNVPIYLDEIDHHLHPQIQEYLTNNFVIKQQQYQIFEEINQNLFKLITEFPNFTQIEIQKYFIENKIPIYLIPVVPSMTNKFKKYDNQKFIWGDKEQEYQLSIIITPNKKYLKETIVTYGFDYLEEIDQYLHKAGFIILE